MNYCSGCSNNIWDDEMQSYICEAPFDQDLIEKMSYDNKRRCPFYVEDAEYKTAKKQL